MLNFIILIIENHAFFDNSWPVDPANGIYPSLLVNWSDEQQINEVYKYCSENKIDNFSISISLKSPLSESFLLHILSFLFIPNYFIVNNRTILNLLGTDEELLKNTKKRILEFAYNQGIENLEINYPAPYEQAMSRNFSENRADCLFSNLDDLKIYYSQALETGNVYNKLFYLYNPQNDIKKLYSMIGALEEEVKNKDPRVYKLTTEMHSIITENELLKRKYIAAINELNNYKSHMEIMRSSHQAKELQDYYTEEYEILPLWYKRLGHIIKVIMGKRTFRSLFNDHVKKYKD